MELSLFVAAAENNVIGNNNQLPWYLPTDLARFKALTTGHPVIMGRKTYQSIGKPLPNRHNIIITRDSDFHAPGCTIVDSLQAAMHAAEQDASAEVFVIGGASIYQLAMPLAQTIYLTRVHAQIPGDTFFELNPADWEITTNQRHTADDKNPYDYSFITLKRR